MDGRIEVASGNTVGFRNWRKMFLDNSHRQFVLSGVPGHPAL